MNIQNNKIPLLAFLESQPFILYVAIASVIFLTPNTYFVYYSFSVFSSPWKEIASAGVALIVASGIMIYTIRGNDKVANYYCWFEVSISMYYYIITINWDWGLIPAMSFCLMLPVSVKYYTKEINNQKNINASENIKNIKESSIQNIKESSIQNIKERASTPEDDMMPNAFTRPGISPFEEPLNHYPDTNNYIGRSMLSLDNEHSYIIKSPNHNDSIYDRFFKSNISKKTQHEPSKAVNRQKNVDNWDDGNPL